MVAGAVHTDPGPINDLSIAISAEGVPGANQITVTVSMLNGASPVGQRSIIHYWLSSDAAGDVLAADPGTTAIAANGTLLAEPVDDLVGILLTEASGVFDLVITHAGTSGFYLNVAMPNGRVFTSSVIQFA